MRTAVVQFMSERVKYRDTDLFPLDTLVLCTGIQVVLPLDMRTDFCTITTHRTITTKVV